VSGIHWEYIVGACIILSGFVWYLAKEFVRWSLSLVLACIGLYDGHADQQLFITILSLWKYVDVSILVNKLCIEIVLYCSLFILRMLPNLQKARFCSFHIQSTLQ
jgi:hypothetical protein